jgi:hypothetical protein
MGIQARVILLKLLLPVPSGKRLSLNFRSFRFSSWEAADVFGSGFKSFAGVY